MKIIVVVIFVICIFCSIFGIAFNADNVFENGLFDIVYTLVGMPSGMVYNNYFTYSYTDEESDGFMSEVFITSSDMEWREVFNRGDRLRKIVGAYVDVHSFFNGCFKMASNEAFAVVAPFRGGQFEFEDGSTVSEGYIETFIEAYENAIDNGVDLPEIEGIKDYYFWTWEYNEQSLLFYMTIFEENALEILEAMYR